jgi:hypothetical protein
MCFVRQPFGLGDREMTLVDLSRRQRGRRSRKGEPYSLLAIKFPEAALRIVGTGFGATRFIDGPQT